MEHEDCLKFSDEIGTKLLHKFADLVKEVYEDPKFIALSEYDKTLVLIASIARIVSGFSHSFSECMTGDIKKTPTEIKETISNIAQINIDHYPLYENGTKQ